jgi:hypothetical protein
VIGFQRQRQDAVGAFLPIHGAALGHQRQAFEQFQIGFLRVLGGAAGNRRHRQGRHADHIACGFQCTTAEQGHHSGQTCGHLRRIQLADFAQGGGNRLQRQAGQRLAGFGNINRQSGTVDTEQDQLGNLWRKADMRHTHRAHQIFQRMQERDHEIQLAHGGIAFQRVQRAEQRMHLRAIVGRAQQHIDGTFDLLVGVTKCFQIISQRIRIAQAGFVEFESTDHEPSLEEN